MNGPALMFKLRHCLAFALLAWFCGTAAAETPMYEDDPYDEITVIEPGAGHEVVKIKPLSSADRQFADKPKSEGKLVVTPLISPDTQREVLWKLVVKIELFDRLILRKANELVAEGNFDEAYDYFVHLERERPMTTGLPKAMEDFLYEQAKAAQAKGRYDEALAFLRELLRRNPKRQGLDQALGMTTDELVGQYLKNQDYAAARVFLQGLGTAYPDNPVYVRWSGQLKGQASSLLAEARAAVDAGQLGKASELSLQMMNIWPELPGARELAQTVHAKYPRLVVGVGTLAANVAPGRLDDWAARRTSRLTYRTLTEFAGPSAEGGKYDCPVGSITSESLGRQLSIQLKPGIRWSQGNATLSNADVSRRLLDMATPGNPNFRMDWSDCLTAVSLRGVFGIEVELRQAHVCPEAMLQVVLSPRGVSEKPEDPPPVNGPFVVKSQSPHENVFAFNEQYFAAKAGQPKEMLERRYDSVAQAVYALKRGEIQLLDRANPWSLAKLREDPQIVVDAYALPLVHCLIPNLDRPLVSDRNFRRALAFGIQRQAILQQLLGGAPTAGCVVTSSPFPLGIGANDPMGYASDETIEPRPFEPRLAVALSSVALESLSTKLKKPKGQEIKVVPKLILAHPSDEIARLACASIKKQLGLVGIPIELRAIEGPLPAKVPDDVDLMYVELAMWEPVVDARRLLGENGMVGKCSPYMSLALRELDEAAEWVQVRGSLRSIHRLAHDDIAVIPLWQLIEHFAYRKNLRGVASKPVTLYQNVEQWRPSFPYPAEK
jgi:tetratricopeptide (TPR) repeat protein